MPAGSGFVLLLELDGTDTEVRQQAAELESLLDGGEVLGIQHPLGSELWRWRCRSEWRDRRTPRRQGQRGHLRAGRSTSPQVIEAIHALGAEHCLPTCAFGHAGDGIVHATFMVDLSGRR